jgi:lipopolysaccharide export system protein LptA
MTCINPLGIACSCLVAGIMLLFQPGPVVALESDRQQPLEVHADTTDGNLGDGKAVLKGNVEIRQGTLLVQADVAEVEKVEGRVRKVILTGKPVHLQQEIEDQGLVTAEARRVEYEVASGIITLTGAADVVHPQYQVRGETLMYDMNLQHFQGNGGDGNGRIRIQLDPEVVPDVSMDSAGEKAADDDEAETEADSENEAQDGGDISVPDGDEEVRTNDTAAEIRVQ